MQHKENHCNHHEMMITDFKKRFFISTILTIPVLLLSPTIQQWFKFSLTFFAQTYVLWFLASIIFVYGGLPFFKGFISELKKKTPGMMTLISVAICVAYGYSTTVVFGIPGKLFFLGARDSC